MVRVSFFGVVALVVVCFVCGDTYAILCLQYSQQPARHNTYFPCLYGMACRNCLVRKALVDDYRFDNYIFLRKGIAYTNASHLRHDNIMIYSEKYIEKFGKA